MGSDRMSPVVTVEREPVDPQADDGELLRRVAGGDRSALIELYQRHGAVVLAQVSLVSGDRGLSEEVLQDTMLAVWHSAASFRGQARVRSWIIAIARRKARDRLRRYQARVVDDHQLAEWPAREPGPEDIAVQRAEAAALATAVSCLRPVHREVLGLVFSSGLSLAETADVLQVPLGTVKSRLAAARSALARVLDERGFAR